MPPRAGPAPFWDATHRLVFGFPLVWGLVSVGASFISMAGLISLPGSDRSIDLLGWTGGGVLLALLLARGAPPPPPEVQERVHSLPRPGAAPAPTAGHP
jgi:hypothetical protein